MPGAPLIGILFGTSVAWIEGWARREEHSVLGYPFGTGGNRSDPEFHLYLPTSIAAAPDLSGLAGALWHGFDAAVDPLTRGQFWTAVAMFCYSDLLDASGTFLAVAKFAGFADQ